MATERGINQAMGPDTWKLDFVSYYCIIIFFPKLTFSKNFLLQFYNFIYIYIQVEYEVYVSIM